MKIKKGKRRQKKTEEDKKQRQKQIEEDKAKPEEDGGR